MLAIELIAFLIPPKPGRIRAINSPFMAEDFRVDRAKRWCDAGKAEVTCGVLVFKDEFSAMISSQFRAYEQERQDYEKFDKMVDAEQSGGKAQKASMAKWTPKHSGRRSKYFGPENRVQQMVRFWPEGTFANKDKV